MFSRPSTVYLSPQIMRSATNTTCVSTPAIQKRPRNGRNRHTTQYTKPKEMVHTAMKTVKTTEAIICMSSARQQREIGDPREQRADTREQRKPVAAQRRILGVDH